MKVFVLAIGVGLTVRNEREWFATPSRVIRSTRLLQPLSDCIRLYLLPVSIVYSLYLDFRSFKPRFTSNDLYCLVGGADSSCLQQTLGEGGSRGEGGSSGQIRTTAGRRGSSYERYFFESRTSDSISHLSVGRLVNHTVEIYPERLSKPHQSPCPAVRDWFCRACKVWPFGAH